MNANALQRAVDEIAFEDDPLKHDGKKGRWTSNGLDVDADLRVIIIVPTAKHSGILFDDEGRKVDKPRSRATPPPRRLVSMRLRTGSRARRSRASSTTTRSAW